MSKRNLRDLPRAELLRKAEEARQQFAAAGKTVEIFFKFTCRHCDERCTFTEPNVLHSFGECHACGKTTKITKGGFMLQMMLFP